MDYNNNESFNVLLKIIQGTQSNLEADFTSETFKEISNNKKLLGNLFYSQIYSSSHYAYKKTIVVGFNLNYSVDENNEILKNKLRLEIKRIKEADQQRRLTFIEIDNQNFKELSGKLKQVYLFILEQSLNLSQAQLLSINRMFKQ